MFIYLVLLFFSLNISSWWWMWLMFEMLNWNLMILMKSNYVVFFLIWQSFTSITIIFSLIYFNKIVNILFLLKMGLPPFHMLVVNLYNMWLFNSFIIFISIHKYLPCLIMFSFMSMSWLILLYLLLGILFFWYKFSMKSFLFGISVFDMFWLLSSWMLSYKIFLIYLIMNFIYMIMLIKIFKNSFYFYGIQILLFLLNMPPFSSFVLKWMILSFFSIMMMYISILMSWLLIIMIWLWMSIQLLNNFMIYKSNNIYFYMFMTSLIWLS